MSKHTPGAMRAARIIYLEQPKPIKGIEEIAQIIDTETNLQELLEAAKGYIERLATMNEEDFENDKDAIEMDRLSDAIARAESRNG